MMYGGGVARSLPTLVFGLCGEHGARTSLGDAIGGCYAGV
jgi:hypothetical protein